MLVALHLAILGLLADQLVDGVIDWDENFIFGNPDKIIDRTTDEAGVFQLAGDVFTADSTGSVEGDTAGQGSEFLIFWESSSAVNGPFTAIPNPEARAGVLNTGRAGFTTQPHASAFIDARSADVFIRLVLTTLLGTLIAILNITSGATIQSISRGGGGGGGGTGLTNPLTENLDIDGFNTILDIDGDTFWKGERDGLADDWVQLVIGGNNPPTSVVAINVSNRVNNEYVRIGLNLEPSIENGGPTLGTIDQRWDAAFINTFIAFDNFAGSQADAGDGRLYWNNTTRHFNQIDDAGAVLDLAASGDLTGWANFPAVADVIPDAVFRNLGSTLTDEQWGTLFLDPSSFIRWETSLGVFTDVFIQGTTGGFNLNVPTAGSYIFNVDTTQAFKVDANQITINAPVLDFADTNSTIQDLRNLLYNTAGGRIIAEASHNGLGAGLILDTDLSASTFFSVGGLDAMRLHESLSQNILELHPNAGIDATRIRGAESIQFDGDGSIASNKATVSATADESLLLTAASGQAIRMFHAASERYSFDDTIFNMINGAGLFQIIPTAGSAFSIAKIGGTPATFTASDDFIFDNPTTAQIVDFRGDINSTGLVPTQLRFRGKNSVGAFETYGEIRSRIALNTSGAERGDLEFYIAQASSPFLTMSLDSNQLVSGNRVLSMHGDIELLSNDGAGHLILNQTDMNMRNLSVGPPPLTGQDGVLYMQQSGGLDALFFRFKSGKVVFLALDN